MSVHVSVHVQWSIGGDAKQCCTVHGSRLQTLAQDTDEVRHSDSQAESGGPLRPLVALATVDITKTTEDYC